MIIITLFSLSLFLFSSLAGLHWRQHRALRCTNQGRGSPRHVQQAGTEHIQLPSGHKAAALQDPRPNPHRACMVGGKLLLQLQHEVQHFSSQTPLVRKKAYIYIHKGRAGIRTYYVSHLSRKYTSVRSFLLPRCKLQVAVYCIYLVYINTTWCVHIEK